MQHELCKSVEKSPQTNPIIGRIEQKAGHGAGMPTQKIVSNVTYGYLLLTLAMTTHLIQKTGLLD